MIQAKLVAIGEGFFLLLPNLLAAALLLLVSWYACKALARGVVRLCTARNRPDLGALLGSLARGTAMMLAVLMAAAIVFPTVNPGDIFATLGIGSVAIGFAFKDILQNLLAGLLLVIQRPYKRGDQIVVKGYEGTVEQIESRATLLKTYDGRRVIIPNSDVYTSPVVVNTAFEQRRDELLVAIGQADDAAAAAGFFAAAVAAVEGVAKQPAVEVLPWGLGESSLELKLRWWCEPRRRDPSQIKGRVIVAVGRAAQAHGVTVPPSTSVVVLQDQTRRSARRPPRDAVAAAG